MVQEEPVLDVSEEDEEDEDENFWDKESTTWILHYGQITQRCNAAASISLVIPQDEKREKGRCLGFNWEASGSGQEVFVRRCGSNQDWLDESWRLLWNFVFDEVAQVREVCKSNCTSRSVLFVRAVKAHTIIQ